MGRSAEILVVDNFDSFTYNAVDALAQLGARVEVRRNDAVSVEEAADYAGIVLSPGPGRPRDAGVCIPLIRALAPHTPLFGICLGHQAIAEAFGGRVVRAKHPIHGQATRIHSRRRGLLASLPAEFEAARYHSLIVDSTHPGRDIEITAVSEDGEAMALRHRRYPTEGVQFHPESYLTPTGPSLFAAFLERVGIARRRAGMLPRR